LRFPLKILLIVLTETTRADGTSAAQRRSIVESATEEDSAMQSRLTTAAAVLAIVAGALVLPQQSRADDKRTDLDCSALFKELNTSNSGKMTEQEAAANPLSQGAFADPTIRAKGFMTDSDFKHACVGTEQKSDSGQ
jgi:hypothetical protein